MFALIQAVQEGVAGGFTPESAANWIEKSYLRARFGSEAAEAILPWSALVGT